MNRPDERTGPVTAPAPSRPTPLGPTPLGPAPLDPAPLDPTPLDLTPGQRWRAVPRRWQVVLVVLAVLAGLELASSFVTGLGGGNGGAAGPSSTYDDSGTGTGALARLLAARHHRVERLTVPLDRATVPAPATLFVLDPTAWTGGDTRALVAALSSGDTVVLGGRPPAAGVVGMLLDTTAVPAWHAVTAGETEPLVSLPVVSGVGHVLADSPGTYGPEPHGNGAMPLLAGPGGDLALVDVGRGTLVLLGSSSPLQNALLGRADDAAFGLDLVAPGAPALFDEYDHGFGRPGRGLAGLPARWRFGLGFAVAAVLVWIVSAARRFGPPDEPERVTTPARVEYVRAMATLLATHPPDELTDVVDPVRAEARRRLCARLGLPDTTPDDALRQRLRAGADASPLPPELAERVLSPARSPSDMVAAGRALAELDPKGADR